VNNNNTGHLYENELHTWSVKIRNLKKKDLITRLLFYDKYVSVFYMKILLKITMYTQYANFAQYFLHSPHSEVTEAAVYAAKCTQLQDAGAAADRMAGKGAL